MKKSYISWQTDTINELLIEANKWCEWFKVFSSEREVTLINVECLKWAESQPLDNRQPQPNNK